MDGKKQETTAMRTETQMLANAGEPVRVSGKAVLLETANRLERRASNLRRLAAALPEEMRLEADEALWELALGIR